MSSLNEEEGNFTTLPSTLSSTYSSTWSPRAPKPGLLSSDKESIEAIHERCYPQCSLHEDPGITFTKLKKKKTQIHSMFFA